MHIHGVIIFRVVDIITTWALTPSWLGCRPPVPHQDDAHCQVPQGGLGGGPVSADPHL